jgi:hypothetical protein
MLMVQLFGFLLPCLVDECCGINSREAIEAMAKRYLCVSAKFQRLQREIIQAAKGRKGSLQQ